jgi:hypothetical protein
MQRALARARRAWPCASPPPLLLCTLLLLLLLLRAWRPAPVAGAARARRVGGPWPPATFADLRAFARGEPAGGSRAHAWSAPLRRLLSAFASSASAPAPPASAAFGCRRGDGGMADQLKGALTSLLVALLSSPPRAFYIDWRRRVCAALSPLEAAWAPAAVDWRPPARWAAAADAAADAGWPPGGGNASFALVRAANAGADDVARMLVAAADARAAHVVVETNLLAFPAAFAAAAAARPGALDASWWRPAAGAGAAAAACRLPPELRALLGGGGGACGDGGGASARAAAWTPFELLDWLAAPTPALAARVAALLARAPPGPRLLVGVHLRVGTAAPGAAYTDQPRDDAAGAAALALRCALRAGAALSAAAAAAPGAPPPPPLVWFVASDSHVARDALRAAAAALPRGAAGAPAAVVEAPERQVIHTDRTSPDDWAPADLAAAFVSVYAEHALLSASHAIVRSNSGFSASAQAWGRVPRAWIIDVATGTCVDDSRDGGDSGADGASGASGAGGVGGARQQPA